MKYKEFIDEILNTRGRFSIPKTEYKERHHIIPRCMGGNDENENLIDLYAREHFIAHKLLAEENPDNIKLVSAWSMMAFPKGSTKRDFEITPEEYEELRIMQAKVMSKFAKELWEDPEYRKAHVVPEWRKEQYRQRMKGKKLGLGKTHTMTDEAKKKLSEANKEAWRNKSEKEKDDFKKKISEAVKGEKNGMYGKHHTDEVKEAQSKRAHLQHSKSKWWNNGIDQKFQEICPNGYKPGRLPFKEGNMVGKYDRSGLTIIRPKHKYLDENGNIHEMDGANKNRWHPNWIEIEEEKGGI